MVEDNIAPADSVHSEAPKVHHEHMAHEHKAEGRGLSRYLKYILVFVLFLAVALVMFYPITLHITANAPGTGADTYQNLWDIWWVRYAIFNLHSNVFYTKIVFWPIGVNLAYVTLAPMLGLISAPLQLVGTVFAYNIMFLLGFALSGFTMFVLADYLTKNHYAALISGFIFTFSAFHIAQSYSHIHFTNIEWIPLFIYFMLRVVNEKRKWTNIIGMSASFALTTLMGNIEQTIMLLFAFILLLIIYLFYKETRKKLLSVDFILSMVVFLILAFIIGIWNFIPLLNAVTSSGGIGIANYLNTAATSAQWSISPVGFFLPSYYNGIVYFSGVPASIYNIAFAPDPVERVGYIGFVVIALALFGIYKYKKEMLPWVVSAVIFGWLALGPSFGLYSVYHAIPGINVVREPGRFDLIVTLFTAIVAAYGAKALFDKFTPHHGSQKQHRDKAYMILAVILILMFIENNGMPIANSPYTITNIKVPALYYGIANLTGNFSVMGLPTFPSGTMPYLYPGEDMFYTSITHRPLVGGYVGGRQNVSSNLLLYNVPLAVQSSSLSTNGTSDYPSPVKQNYTNQTLLTLYNYNTEFVVLHKDAYNQSELNQIGAYLLSVFGSPIYNDNTTTAFQTLTAINRSVFNSFVGYPVFTQWEQTSIFLSGEYQSFWVPISPGSIAVYAPYQNATAARGSDVASYINTTISFVAVSNGPQQLYIEAPTNSNKTVTIAVLNVTSSAQKYTLRTVLASGPIGNILYFVYQNPSSPILIQNITFSR